MKCIDCGKKIGVFDEACPYCGAKQYDEEIALTKQSAGVNSKEKQAMLSEEECFIYGIHPNDEMYRKTMELNILSKKY